MIRKLMSLLPCCLVISFFLLGEGIVGFTSADSPRLVYKYTKLFQPNNVAVGIWTPIDKNKTYFPLGDLATTIGVNYPTETAMVVLDNDDDLVAPPISMTQIGKSGTMAAFSLNPPDGFTCIGIVAFNSLDPNNKPDMNNYRCLRSDLVTSGDSILHWSNNDAKFSLWNVIPIKSSKGLATGTFVYTKSKNAKPSSVFVVNSAMTIREYDPPLVDYDYKMQFSPDNNNNRISIWTPIDKNKDYFPLGDITSISSTRPINDSDAMMVRDNNDGLVAPPDSLSETWKVGTMKIFIMNAPIGYKCIGNVAIDSATFDAVPDKNLYRCLRSDLVIPGNTSLAKPWFNAPTLKDLTLWKIIPEYKNSQGLVTGTFVNSISPTKKPQGTSVVNSNIIYRVYVPPPPLLVYKYTKLFKHDYPSIGIWTPVDKNKNYFPLGDLATTNGGNYPYETAMMVLDNNNGLVAPPKSITKIRTQGSMVAFSLDAPEGYTCIGIVVIDSWDVNFEPDKNNYRCLRSDLVTPAGDSTLYYSDSILAFWNVIPSKSEDLATGTFVCTSSPNVKPSNVFVVNSKKTAQEYNPPPLLVYKTTKAYNVVWANGANSYWRPVDFFNRGYYPMGDVFVHGVNYPAEQNAMMVQDNGDGLVAPPASVTVWFGSKDLGGSFVQLNPQPGYTCMGIAVILRFDGLVPDKNQFRCLRSDLVFPADVTIRMKYAGKSIWNIIGKQKSAEPVIETGLSIAFNTVDTKPDGWQASAFVVRANIATDLDSSYPTDKTNDIALVLYETSNLDNVWNNFQKPDNAQPVSIWRAKECCSLGDTAVGNILYPLAAYMVKDVTPSKNALTKPNSFERVYYSGGTKIGRVTVWIPKCQPKYVALGYVAKSVVNEDLTPPSIDATNFRCVLESIVNKNAVWTKIYDDRFSASKQECTFWRADPATIRSDSVGVWAMSAVGKYTEMDNDALALNAANVSIRFQKPIRSMRISNVVYDFDNKQILSQGSSDISNSRAKAANCGGNTETQTSLSVGYSASLSSTFTLSVGMEVGIEIGFEAEIPLVAKQTTTMSFKMSASMSNAITTTTTVSSTFTQLVPTKPGYTDSFYVMGTKYVANIPYTADVLTTYTDGTSSQGTTTGMFYGQSFSEIGFVREDSVYCGPITTTTETSPATTATPPKSG